MSFSSLELENIPNVEKNIGDYISLWNVVNPDELKPEQFIDFVDPNCKNRFGLLGPEGFVHIVRNRRLAFPDDFQMSLHNLDVGYNFEEGRHEARATIYFEGIYEGVVERVRGNKIRVFSDTVYYLTDSGRIIGGKSNMRPQIISALGVETEEEVLTIGEF
ncbi:hypothetical protein GF389_05645 [Candidatus Dojkabacteria bacterium]|nr:hypothetical protein [Candidatus Dojkabacteria bacterium]